MHGEESALPADSGMRGYGIWDGGDGGKNTCCSPYTKLSHPRVGRHTNGYGARSRYGDRVIPCDKMEWTF